MVWRGLPNLEGSLVLYEYLLRQLVEGVLFLWAGALGVDDEALLRVEMVAVGHDVSDPAPAFGLLLYTDPGALDDGRVLPSRWKTPFSRIISIWLTTSVNLIEFV